MMGIIKKNNLPFNYVGNGSIHFRGYGKLFNPDFLSKNPKHIIEVFGDYWHSLPKRKKLDKQRLATYTRYGYKTLVIWEHELIRNKKWVLARKPVLSLQKRHWSTMPLRLPFRKWFTIWQAASPQSNNGIGKIRERCWQIVQNTKGINYRKNIIDPLRLY